MCDDVDLADRLTYDGELLGDDAAFDALARLLLAVAKKRAAAEQEQEGEQAA